MAARYEYYDHDGNRYIGTVIPIDTVATGYEPDYIFQDDKGLISRPVYSSDIEQIPLDVDYVLNAAEAIHTFYGGQAAGPLYHILEYHGIPIN